MKDRLLPLNALRAFSAVFETGGVRSAARVLDVTHSSVSRHVRYLEDIVGVALLERDQNQRTLSFTPQGERLGKATKESLAILSNAIAAIRETHTRNSVVISTSPSFASRWLMPRINAFNDLFPWIEISVLADQRLTNLTEQSADIGIRIGSGAWAESEYRFLMNETLFPVCSPSYAETLKAPDSLDCLRDAKLVHDRDPQTSWDAWRKEFEIERFDTAPGPRFASTDMVLDAAAKGLGVALARGRLAEPELQDGRLVRLCAPQEIVIRGAYWIIVRPDSAQQKAVVHFVDWLHHECSKPGVFDPV